MTTIAPPARVALWTVKGLPVRLVWSGHRYVVTDTPTPLRRTVEDELLTHPLQSLAGWRFQGTSEAGESYIFDVRSRGADQWELVAVYL